MILCVSAYPSPFPLRGTGAHHSKAQLPTRCWLPLRHCCEVRTFALPALKDDSGACLWSTVIFGAAVGRVLQYAHLAFVPLGRRDLVGAR